MILTFIIDHLYLVNILKVTFIKVVEMCVLIKCKLLRPKTIVYWHSFE